VRVRMQTHSPWHLQMILQQTYCIPYLAIYNCFFYCLRTCKKASFSYPRNISFLFNILLIFSISSFSNVTHAQVNKSHDFESNHLFSCAIPRLSNFDFSDAEIIDVDSSIKIIHLSDGGYVYYDNYTFKSIEQLKDSTYLGLFNSYLFFSKFIGSNDSLFFLDPKNMRLQLVAHNFVAGEQFDIYESSFIVHGKYFYLTSNVNLYKGMFQNSVLHFEKLVDYHNGAFMYNVDENSLELIARDLFRVSLYSGPSFPIISINNSIYKITEDRLTRIAYVNPLVLNDNISFYDINHVQISDNYLYFSYFNSFDMSVKENPLLVEKQLYKFFLREGQNIITGNGANTSLFKIDLLVEGPSIIEKIEMDKSKNGQFDYIFSGNKIFLLSRIVSRDSDIDGVDEYRLYIGIGGRIVEVKTNDLLGDFFSDYLKN
jgi:hypothetical protein